MSKGTPITAVRFGTEATEALDKIATQRETTKSEIIRDIILRWLKRQDHKRQGPLE